MECNHLELSVEISPAFVSRLMNENRNLWSCSVCKTNKSPWMCLKCGEVLCGRYVNGHAKIHSESCTSHNVCIDASLMVFCYKCDDFVINDTSTGDINLIRTALQNEIPRIQKRKRRQSIDQQISKESPMKKLNRSPSKENKGGNNVRTVGLRNLGNTCFMNAILQSLSNLKYFSGYFKELPAIELNVKNMDEQTKKYYTRSYQSDDISLVEELRKVLCALWQQGSNTAISPESLFTVVWKVVPRFRGYQQHDAHEFMHCLLDRVHNELLTSKRFTNGCDTIISGIFGGQLQSDVTCLTCGTISKKQEAYRDLSLDIPFKPKLKVSPGKKKTPSACQLIDCLQSFVEMETLDESEWYMCEKCNKKQPSTKKFWILRLPNVLCLHLKRFRYSPLARTKVDTFVRFPIKELNMDPFILKTNQKTNRMSIKAHLYDLAACVVHHGSGAGSGHYTTYARHEGSWYNFNDSSVSLTNEESIQHCKAYILFYTRQYPDVSIIERIKNNYV
ncbi:ubiquitin carboxyl-terminal hydrolase 3 isoform X3 [Hydra vulgaris]|uniref:ubiquitinyl hydrolase 1 n=1 Tax=Hydra vulgaris TaxID=6087 RepID=A0ABM4DD99_HYDVU